MSVGHSVFHDHSDESLEIVDRITDCIPTLEGSDDSEASVVVDPVDDRCLLVEDGQLLVEHESRRVDSNVRRPRREGNRPGHVVEAGSLG